MSVTERTSPQQVPSPPNEAEDDFHPPVYPPAPTWAPPPPPIQTDPKGKGTWRPSGPATPPVIAPPSPPTEDEISPVTEAGSPPTSWAPSPPIVQVETPPTAGDSDDCQPPTFAESQAQFGHTNPLLAHPVQQPTSHVPPEKMPMDQLQHDMSSFGIPNPPVQPPLPPMIHPPTNLELSPSSSTDLPGPSTLVPTMSGQSSPRDPQPHKQGWFSQLSQKTTNQINSLAHKFGGTGFLPEDLDNECEKAALILRTFCKKGIYADAPASAAQQSPPLDGQPSSSSSPSSSSAAATRASATQKRPKTLVTIPTKVISKAVGLAIFTTFRAGLQFKGATGSGILVARKHDGSWSGPSAIQLHSFGGGFVAGLDVFDCVCVINSQEALSAFMDTRVSLGGEVAIVAGPWGAGGSVEWGALMDKRFENEADKEKGTSSTEASPPSPPALEVNGEPMKVEKETRTGGRRGSKPKKLSPVFSYVKSRGFYCGFGYDGTIVTERKAANAAFYGDKVTCEQILRGQVAPPEDNPSLQSLFDVLRGAEGGPLPTASSETAIDGPADAPEEEEASPVSDLPPAYPVDSLHPVEAFMPEKR